MKYCECGSGLHAEVCCMPYVEGRAFPETPEKLMRSRYVAYKVLNIQYIADTMLGKAKEGFDPEDAEAWAKDIEWLGLTVVKAPAVKPGETKGFVEFVARYRLGQEEKMLHEVSEFVLEKEHWYYCDGVFPKKNRNDPCVCGSGKKYKKCCLNKI